MSHFFTQTLERSFPDDFSGDILVWDIDKTYLDTHFSSLRGLLQIPLEFAIDKEAIPGSIPLLRALRRGPGRENALVPLLFVSGSPPQLQHVIARKMLLDGVEYDGLTFKDQLGLLRRGQLRDLAQQIGYKLCALLSYANQCPKKAHWLLFGDDVEQDAEVFSLFGDVLAGLRGRDFIKQLQRHKVSGHFAKLAQSLAESLPIYHEPIAAIFVHLVRKSAPKRFAHLPKVIASKSFLQTALVLGQKQKIAEPAIAAVAADLRQRHIEEVELQQQLVDARERLQIPEELLRFAQQP